MLVDTPGIESEAPLLERFVDEYLHNCVGFIYVLHDSVNVHRVRYLSGFSKCDL